MNDFGIDLIKEVKSENAHEKGVLYTDEDGQYIVSLFRDRKEPKPLSGSERFTIAHEIGHILLKEKFDWTPDSKDEYRVKEEFCNIFAANLLVPKRAIEVFKYDDAKKAFKSLKKVRKKCNVSYEVSARRISDVVGHIIYVYGVKKRDANDEPVVKVKWSASEIEEYPLNRHKHLSREHEIGRILLANNTYESRNKTPSPVGPSFITWDGDNVCAAVVYRSQLSFESSGVSTN